MYCYFFLHYINLSATFEKKITSNSTLTLALLKNKNKTIVKINYARFLKSCEYHIFLKYNIRPRGMTRYHHYFEFILKRNIKYHHTCQDLTLSKKLVSNSKEKK